MGDKDAKRREERRDAVKLSRRGFTLLEVMIALALLGLALVVLIKSAAGQHLQRRAGAHDGRRDRPRARARCTTSRRSCSRTASPIPTQSQTETTKMFEDEGWPNITTCYKVERSSCRAAISCRRWLARAAREGSARARLGSGSGSGSAFGSDAHGGFQNSALGGMLGMMGGGFGAGGRQRRHRRAGRVAHPEPVHDVPGDPEGLVRKVTLTVTWKVIGSDRDMKVVAFFTDAAAMDKVLNGMGSQELPDDAARARLGHGLGQRPGRDVRGSGRSGNAGTVARQ